MRVAHSPAPVPASAGQEFARSAEYGISPVLMATVAATLVLPLLLSAIALMMSGLELATVVVIPVTVVSLLHVLVIGLPAFALLRRTDHASPFTMTFVGFTGALVSLGGLLIYLQAGWPTSDEWLRTSGFMAIWGAFGVISALAFWYAWVYSCKALGPIQHGRKQLVK
jgi:hypothetical protein